jgi:tRNA-dihydrouridine synthase B
MDLTSPWTLGGLTVPNRVALAPLAGIGNWCVRLQARRYGAGLLVSEMVSSHAIHHGNEKTLVELLRIDPRERDDSVPGPRPVVSMQLFGQDPDVMRSAAATVAERGADVIDLNMGCPVPKVCKTGAGAALLKDPDTAVAVARAAAEGSGLPVTVKLRSGSRKGDVDGADLAVRLAEEAGVAALAFHPRSAQVHHKGIPDYDLAAEVVERVDVPVILTGGMDDAAGIRAAAAHTGATAVMLARGGLGNPWLFAELLDAGDGAPSRDAVLDELDWMIAALDDHLGTERAGRYLRKVYPWYMQTLGEGKETNARLQRTGSIDEARAILAELRAPAAALA